MGTLIAWVLVRDDFRGKSLVNALIDLPFALPTIVAGLTLLSLYGPRSPFGINIAYTQAGILVALLFVTLPFVVRAVQPVLLELDRDMEEAAASLGASPATVVRRIVLPNLVPAMLTGCCIGLRSSRRRIWLGGADLGQPAVSYRGRVGQHLQPAGERRPGQRSGHFRSSCSFAALLMLSALDFIRRRTTHDESGT